MSQTENITNPTKSFKDLPEMRQAHASLVTERRQTGLSPEFLAKVTTFVAQGIATGVNLNNLTDRKSAQSMLDYWDNILQREGLGDIDPTLAEFDLESQPELSDDLCPYVGLYAFQEDDKNVFYGRQRLAARLFQHVQDHRFLAVVGPSGSGKSSVVRAGLLPELQENALANKATFLPGFVPGSNPLANLALAIKPENTPSDWAALQANNLLENNQHLANLLAKYYSGDCVLFIDQFEETFTLCLDEAERLAFAKNLLAVIEDDRANHHLILTLRTDFEPFLQRLSPAFMAAFEQARVRVMPMNAGELREAILRPAAEVDLHFEDSIVEGLLQDLLGEPAALPLLQFTLLKLWEKRERNRVPLQAYEALGGGRLALANSADAFHNELIPEERVTMRRILLRMVRPGDGLEVTNNRVQRSTLYQAGEAQDRVDRVLAKLAAARLVRISEPDSADAQVEVAHEALIRNWPLLVEWLDEDRVVMRQRLRLTTAAEEWDRLRRDPNALWRGAMLVEAQSYTDLNLLEEDFVEASVAAEEAARKRVIRRYQFFALGLGLLLLVALGAAGWAWDQRGDALEQRANALLEKEKADSAVVIASTALAEQAVLLVKQREQVMTVPPLAHSSRTPAPDGAEMEATREDENAESAPEETSLPQTRPVERETAVPQQTPSLPEIEVDLAVQQEIVQEIDEQLVVVRATQAALIVNLPTTAQTTVLGNSVRGEPIELIQFGSGAKKIVVVGGIHAGQSPNTVEIVDKFVSYFQANPEKVPAYATLYFVPNLNPDSPNAPDELKGRLNANGVDLNRNWGCAWQDNPRVRGVVLEGAGGTQPLSEPETSALAEFLLGINPELVIFYDAPVSGGAIGPGGCSEINKDALALSRIYGAASGYGLLNLVGGTVQGDASNWLDTVDIPAFFVELANVTYTDFDNNLLALESVLDQFAEQ